MTNHEFILIMFTGIGAHRQNLYPNRWIQGHLQKVKKGRKAPQRKDGVHLRGPQY